MLSVVKVELVSRRKARYPDREMPKWTGEKVGDSHMNSARTEEKQVCFGC